MSIKGADKVHLNISTEFWVKAGLVKIAEEKGVSITQIIQEAVVEKYPKILDFRTKIVRRLI